MILGRQFLLPFDSSVLFPSISQLFQLARFFLAQFRRYSFALEEALDASNLILHARTLGGGVFTARALDPFALDATLGRSFVLRAHRRRNGDRARETVSAWRVEKSGGCVCSGAKKCILIFVYIRAFRTR